MNSNNVFAFNSSNTHIGALRRSDFKNFRHFFMNLVDLRFSI